MAGQRDGASRLYRERDDPRAGAFPCSQLVGERWHKEPRGALSSGGWRSVADEGARRIFGAGDGLPEISIPPSVENHSVGSWKCACRNGRVADAGDRIQIRICGVAEPGAMIDQSTKSCRPPSFELIEIVGPQLIDHDHHDELGWRSTR